MSAKINSKKKVVVLGAGRVGKAIALDLAEDYEVLAIDASESNLRQVRSKSLKTIKADISDRKKLHDLIKNCDLVVSALPGFMAFKILKSVIQLGKNIVDISFFSEDPFKLDALAKKKKVTVVVDAGVAPGLSNLILGYHSKRMVVNSFICYVGGLPKFPIWPYEYKAPFSPIDVVEEYIRPARMIKNGALVTKPALSEVEEITFNKIGILEAFNTDGLRTLIKTTDVKNMKEKTLRYPGHADYMKVLRETGFFKSKEINVKGVKVKPIDVTSQLLFPHWRLEEGEEEFTIMRIIIEGKENNKASKYIYDIFDQYDKKSRLTSMSRTTGYTCCAIARLVLQGQINDVGIVPPEFIGSREDLFKKILGDLKSKNISVKVKKIYV